MIHQTGTVVTNDFAAFVATHGPRIARACAEIAGNDEVAQALRDDLLADVAGRWRRWPAGSRPERALARIERLLQREARAQHVTVHPSALDLRSSLCLRAVPFGSVDEQPEPDMPDRQEAAQHLAATAWRRATRGRRAWRTGIAVAALAAIAVALLRPPAPPPEPPLPTEIPAGVTIVPDFDELMSGLTGWLSDLPPYLTLGPSDVDALPALTDAPLDRATLVVQADGFRLVVAGDEAAPDEPIRTLMPPQRRRVEHPALRNARLAASSLSPDGTMVALPTDDGLVLVDARRGDVHTVAVAGVHPASPLAWLDATRVMVAGSESRVVDVTTNAVQSAEVEATDVLSLRGYGTPRLAQLVPVAPGANATEGPHTIRALLLLWREMDAAGNVEPVAGAGQVGVRRIVTGPPWFSAWVGPGFASPQLVVRACDPATLLLPRDVGPATGAVAAIDGNGNEMGTLVATGGARLDALGVVRHEREQALVAVRAEGRSMVVAWDPYARTFRAVTHVNADTQVSIADLGERCPYCPLVVELDPEGVEPGPENLELGPENLELDQENAAIPVNASPTTS